MSQPLDPDRVWRATLKPIDIVLLLRRLCNDALKWKNYVIGKTFMVIISHDEF